ncbi:AMP-binding protein [Auritidibacter ignavus]|uniref:AMP-binding protein n=1 Tax=Auritidibacter ignavus TaxID=678932 RepID=UPI0024B9AB3E|nr:AMP-binding protein [Auritidibacter ignavus]WHS28598.1 AMP-binding protein [Auritidibacter ignavus]
MDLPTPHQLDQMLVALQRAMDHTGDPVEFTGSGEVIFRPEARDPARGGGPDIAAVVRTSGSTGRPKQTLLSTSALQASATATAEALAGQGRWLLAVGAQFVAGLAVLSRSIMAGTTPLVLPSGSFTAEKFVATTAGLNGRTPVEQPRYVSLVPTQLTRLLEAGEAIPEVIDGLRSYSAVLVGGARAPQASVEAARQHGIKLMLTYGSSETCGGCVYNGRPLPGVDLGLARHTIAGGAAVDRVTLTGAMVATGYLDQPKLTAEHFRTGPDGTRTYLTDDYGEILTASTSQTPQLRVLGRVDDVLISGAVKVSAAEIQRVLESHPTIREAFVTGVADDHWGQRIVAGIVPAEDAAIESGSQRDTALRRWVRAQLGEAAAPKSFTVLDRIPLLANGKPDRRYLQQLLSE